MKKYNLYQRLLISLLSLLFIASCGKFDDLKNPLDGFKIYINYDIFDTFLSFRFIDTATGQLISTTDVRATIQGTHKGGVVDQFGNNKDSYTSVYGLMSLALNPKDPYVPADDNPIQFSVLATASGYQDQKTDITLNETGVHYFNIYLEKESALTQGYKKYIRNIPLSNSSLVNSFSLQSSSGECVINIPKDVRLLDKDHNVVEDTIAIAELIVYTNVNKAPISQQLVTDVEIDGNITKKAYNPISIISFSLKTVSAEIHYTDNGEINFVFGLDSDFINPLTNEKLVADDILPVCNYNNLWKQEAENTIEKDGDSLFIEFNTNHLSLFSVGVFQSICTFTGNILFNFSNDFPTEPIGTRLYCYREKDNKYIGRIDYDLTLQTLARDFSFMVPVDNSVKLRIRQKSSTNGFNAVPANISVEDPCYQNNGFNVTLTSTSINFRGQINFHFLETFPNNNFNLRIGFYNADNDGYLFSKVYNVSQDKTIQIDTGIPNIQNLYLKFSAVNQDDAFTSSPDKIIIEDPSISNQAWSVNLTPKNCLLSGNFDFSYTDDFENETIEIKLLFINKEFGSTDKQKIITFQPSTNIVPFSVVLPKNEQYDVRIMRTASGQKFQAYPYQFRIEQACAEGTIWDVSLSPVVEQLTIFNVTVVCPSTEILPTLQGFYRIVWEDDWHNAEIVNGFIEMVLEMNGTYEIGLIIDDEMKIQEHKVTDTINYITYELNDEECDKMGW
jgi:hypothetical protein